MSNPYDLSDPARIKQVRDQLALWLTNNAVELHELRRALAMLLREDDERKKKEAFERRH